MRLISALLCATAAASLSMQAAAQEDMYGSSDFQLSGMPIQQQQQLPVQQQQLPVQQQQQLPVQQEMPVKQQLPVQQLQQQMPIQQQLPIQQLQPIQQQQQLPIQQQQQLPIQQQQLPIQQQQSIPIKQSLPIQQQLPVKQSLPVQQQQQMPIQQQSFPLLSVKQSLPVQQPKLTKSANVGISGDMQQQQQLSSFQNWANTHLGTVGDFSNANMQQQPFAASPLLGADSSVSSPSTASLWANLNNNVNSDFDNNMLLSSLFNHEQQQQAAFDQSIMSSLPLKQQQQWRMNSLPISEVPVSTPAARSLDIDVDRIFGYTVSPTIDAPNSRSVDIQLSPILSASRKSIKLPTMRPHSKMHKVHWQQQYPVADVHEQSFYGVQEPILASAPLQQQQSFNTPTVTNANINAILASLAGVNSVGVDNFNTVPLTSHSNVFFDNNVHPINTLSHNEIMDAIASPTQHIVSSSILLSSIHPSLPSVPLTTANLVNVGASTPAVFSGRLLAPCVQGKMPESLCVKVSKAAKLLVQSKSVGGNDQF